MKKLTRRSLLQSSLAAPAVSVAVAAAEEAQAQAAQTAPGAGRERLLLDFGWRFHLGNATDAAQDFNFRGNFSKTGNLVQAGTPLFDDNEWKSVELPHDWAVELPFQNDPALSSKGFYPLGRNYPATSVGWYRRVFDLPASAAGKRISIEFDGAYREAMVVFNGFYVGRHVGGYDPFSFDVTDFANPGGTNVLLVRVDATQSDGWFYEGAGIYRHVWLVKPTRCTLSSGEPSRGPKCGRAKLPCRFARKWRTKGRPRRVRASNRRSSTRRARPWARRPACPLPSPKATNAITSSNWS